MSAIEFESINNHSNLVVDTISAGSITTSNEFISNSITTTSLSTSELTASGNSNLNYISAYQLNLNNSLPSIIYHNSVTTLTSAINLITQAILNGGIIIGNYTTASFKFNFDSAANLYAAFPMLPNQVMQILVVNVTNNQLIFDTIDTAHVMYNNVSYTPILQPLSQKILYVMMTGTAVNPVYNILG